MPILPGILFMFIVALTFAFLDGFEHITTINIIVLGIIFLISLVVDYLSGLMGGKYFGATKKGILGGFIGMIIGTLFFAPIGTLAGLFLGILITELVFGRNRKEATKAAAGSFIGTVVGISINLVLALMFLVLFVIFSI